MSHEAPKLVRPGSRPGGGPRRARRRVGQEGFSIIEVMVSAVVLGIAVIGLALTFSSGHGFVLAQGNERVALFLAEEKMEQLRALGFAGIVVASFPQTETLSAGKGGTQSFTRLTQVDCVANKGPYDTAIACPSPILTKRITVTVTPTSMRQAMPVVLRTVLTTTP